jgi:hypothetical protein
MFCLVKIKKDPNPRPPHELGMHFSNYGVLLHVCKLDTFNTFE